VRDDSHWRLKHACPACTYTLRDKKNLKFKMLFMMDGNDSLKWVQWREPLFDYTEVEGGDIQLVGVLNELPDNCVIKSDYYLGHKQVLEWTESSVRIMSQKEGEVSYF
jgi:hypothetical protein